MPLLNPTMVYVDPSIGTNTGVGSIGNPYGNLNYAFLQTTPDTTNGTQFNVKSTGVDVVPSGGYQCGAFNNISEGTYICGYTTTANDGGKCTIRSSSQDLVFGNGGANLRPTRFECRDIIYDADNNGLASFHLGFSSKIENCGGVNSASFAVLANSRITRCETNYQLNTAAQVDAGVSNCSIVGATINLPFINNKICVDCVCVGSGVVINNFSNPTQTTGNISVMPAAGNRNHFRPANTAPFLAEDNIIIGSGECTAFDLYRSNVSLRNNLYFNVGTFVDDQDSSGTPSKWVLENNIQMNADPFVDSANADFRFTTAAKQESYYPRLAAILARHVIGGTPGITTDPLADLISGSGGGGLFDPLRGGLIG